MILFMIDLYVTCCNFGLKILRIFVSNGGYLSILELGWTADTISTVGYRMDVYCHILCLEQNNRQQLVICEKMPKPYKITPISNEES
jgi:hypothetical protein